MFYVTNLKEESNKEQTSGVVSPTSTTPSRSTPPPARTASPLSPSAAVTNSSPATGSNANSASSGCTPGSGSTIPSYPVVPCPTFDWDAYLKETNSIPAPPDYFQQVSNNECRKGCAALICFPMLCTTFPDKSRVVMVLDERICAIISFVY